MGAMSMRNAVDSALLAAPPAEADHAAAELARKYADEIDSMDEGSELGKLGPALLSCLEALHLTPRARALARKGEVSSDKSGGGKLDELRAKRARKNGAEALDPTAT